MKTICLNGKKGGKINDLNVDSNLIIPSKVTARIQESHIMIIHIWCNLIDSNRQQCLELWAINRIYTKIIDEA